MDRPFRHIVIALTLTCCVLTTWVYPYHEKQLVAISRVATMPLIARNVVFAVLVVFLQVHAWRWSGRKRRPVGVPLGMEATGAR